MIESPKDLKRLIFFNDFEILLNNLQELRFHECIVLLIMCNLPTPITSLEQHVIFYNRMKENKKRLTLRTPYNTLLNHVWEFKKNSYDLDKQNLQLKSKILFAADSKSDHKLQNKSRTKNKTADLKKRMKCTPGQQPSKQLIEKLGELKQANYRLKSEIVQLEQSRKLMVEELLGMNKLQRKIRKMEGKLKKNNNKIKKYKLLRNRKPQVSNQLKMQGATLDILEEQIGKQSTKTQVLQNRMSECEKRFDKAVRMERKLGREIIELIDEKNFLRKKLKNEEKGQEKVSLKNIR